MPAASREELPCRDLHTIAAVYIKYQTVQAAGVTAAKGNREGSSSSNGRDVPGEPTEAWCWTSSLTKTGACFPPI